MKIGQKWPENEMQECKVIFSRTLTALTLPVAGNVIKLNQEGDPELGQGQKVADSRVVLALLGVLVSIQPKTLVRLVMAD
ncbi:MAG: hypothetical protein GY941_24175 [Planctomycetes bacterium]|nr:hypothetical protein [Planctomycetota bacterium]